MQKQLRVAYLCNRLRGVTDRVPASPPAARTALADIASAPGVAARAATATVHAAVVLMYTDEASRRGWWDSLRCGIVGVRR